MYLSLHLALLLSVLLSFAENVVAVWGLYSVGICKNYLVEDASTGNIFPAYNGCNPNGTSHLTRCNFHPLIPHESSPIPSWVNSSTQTLFSQTIEKAQNGTLTNIYDFWGNLQPQPYRTWAANMVAQDTWRTSTSLYDKGRNGSFTGYANLGFHPFGDFPGTWLTQIIGQVAIASDNEWRLRNDTEMWTSIVKINDTSPCCKDLFCNSSIITPSPLVKDCLLDDRTDTDMILHGFENDCRWATQVPKPSPRHFDCPDLGRVKTKQELDAENRAGMWDCVQATPTTLARSEAAKRFRNMELSVKSIIVSGYIGLLLWVYG